MSQVPQPTQPLHTLPSSAFNPQKMAIARQLNQDMALIQANELLTQDILNKVASLSELEKQILSQNPQAKERIDFVIKSFTYTSVRHLK